MPLNALSELFNGGLDKILSLIRRLSPKFNALSPSQAKNPIFASWLSNTFKLSIMISFSGTNRLIISKPTKRFTWFSGKLSFL